VSDLDEIVNFCAAADTCFADRGTVDRGIGAYFDVIFENNDAGLHDLVIGAVVLLGVSKAVGTDFCAVLENDVVAKDTELSNSHVCIGLQVIACVNTAADMDKWVNGAVASDADIVFDHYIRTDGSTFSNLCRGSDNGSRIDAAHRLWRLIEEFYRARERQIRIGAPQGRHRHFRKFVGHDHGARPGGARLGRVLRIGNERQMAGAGLVDAYDAGDLHVAVTVQDTVQTRRNVG